MSRLIIISVFLLFVVQVNAYNINSGDVLHLEVYGESELSLDVTVDSNGYIDYPFVGKVKVLNYQVETIKNTIIDKLKDGYFVNPQVTVFVKKYQPFYIQGEVESPGPYDYESGMTVRKAIALAGGLTERASKKKIYLTHADELSKGQVKVSMEQEISSGDILQIKESFF